MTRAGDCRIPCNVARSDHGHISEEESGLLALKFITVIYHNGMATNPLTSIPVHSDVLRHLRTLKTADQTWDDFLLEMSRDYVPPGWYNEMERRRKAGVDVAGDAVLKRSHVLARLGR